ncbi:MAG: ABC transporter permease, partial [Deltaproteobacteria bacterium]|nr:ABC transporter permease [Deltaproteobacteria bacterium]
MTHEITRVQSEPKILKFLPYLSVITFIVAWQLLVDSGVIPKELLATPTDVAKMFLRKLADTSPDGKLLSTHLLISVTEAFVGYILSLLIGLPLGLLMGWFRLAEGLARPIFEMLRPIPPIAFIPLAVFWFGIGMTGKIFIIWVSGVVPCVINAYVGVKMTNPTLINMARTYGASNWQIFLNLCIPSAMPMIFGALQIALAYCWICLVTAELVAANAGLGFMITMGRRLVLPDMIVLGMVMVGLTGAIIG